MAAAQPGGGGRRHGSGTSSDDEGGAADTEGLAGASALRPLPLAPSGASTPVSCASLPSGQALAQGAVEVSAGAGATVSFAEVRFWVLPGSETSLRVCKRVLRRGCRRAVSLPASQGGAAEAEGPGLDDSSGLPTCVPRPPTKLKVLLDGVTGLFRPGTLNCITGPSGCGKSTLLLLLCGRASSGVLTGVRAVNGRCMGTSAAFDSLARDVIGFLPQADTLPEHLTARQVLMHARALALAGRRLDAAVEGQKHSAAAVRQSVGLAPAGGAAARGSLLPWCGSGVEALVEWADATLLDLGLGEAGDTTVGGAVTGRRGLSGGQRRRLSLGVVLAREPLVIAADEVSSGLDATSALSVMQTLKRIAVRGRRTVVCVLHQPRSELWDLLDDILVLGKGGRQHFMGRAAGVVPILATKLRRLTAAEDSAIGTAAAAKPAGAAPTRDGDDWAESELQALLKQPDVRRPATYANAGDWVSDAVQELDRLGTAARGRGDPSVWDGSEERRAALIAVRAEVLAARESEVAARGSDRRRRRAATLSLLDVDKALEGPAGPRLLRRSAGRAAVDCARGATSGVAGCLRSACNVSGWHAVADDAIVAFARRWRFYTGEWTTLAGLLAQEAVVALIIALAFVQRAERYTEGPWTDDAYRVAAFVTLCSSYACVASYLHVVPRYFTERPVLLQERGARTMSHAGYTIGVALAELPMAVLESASILGSTYWLVGMNPDPRVALATGCILVLTVAAWQAQMGLLNSLTDSLEAAYTLNFLALGLATIYGGVLVRPSDTPWPFLPAYYGVAPALGFRSMLQSDLQCCYMSVPCETVAVAAGPVVDAVVDSARRDNPGFSALGGRIDTASLLVAACESINITTSAASAFAAVAAGAPAAGQWGSPLLVRTLAPANASVNLGAVYLSQLEILDVVAGDPGGRAGVNGSLIPASDDVFSSLHGMGYDQLTMNVTVLVWVALGFRALQIAAMSLRESCKGRANHVAMGTVLTSLIDGDFERHADTAAGAAAPGSGASVTGAAAPPAGAPPWAAGGGLVASPPLTLRVQRAAVAASPPPPRVAPLPFRASVLNPLAAETRLGTRH